MLKETVQKMKVNYKPTIKDWLQLAAMVGCVLVVCIIETL